MALIQSVLDWFQQAIAIVLHLDAHLNAWGAALGPWLYAALAAVVFCETGLVVTPFLPGDSLLFAVGALAASEGSPIRPELAMLTLAGAAMLGDVVNYTVGYHLGPKVFAREDSWLLNKRHLARTHEFYERHGGKTIILARFMPIVRTFAPFVAGVARMSIRRYAAFCVVGALLWVNLFIWAGHWFGNLPAVKKNFHVVIFAIIGISILPAVIEFLRERKRLSAAKQLAV